MPVEMMQSVFLVLIVVHASHLVCSPFHPSSLSFPLPHLSKIDDFQNTYRECLIEKMEICEQFQYTHESLARTMCIAKGFTKCNMHFKVIGQKRIDPL